MNRPHSAWHPSSHTARLGWASGLFPAALLLLVLLAPRPATANRPGKWEKWENAVLADGYMDGDSFYIRHGNRNDIIRLYFVDCPESNEQFKDRNREQADYFNVSLARIVPLGQQGEKFARRFLSGKKLTVWTRWEDALGSSHQKRYFGLVRVGQEDLGEQLVAHGLARVYGHSTVLPDGTSPNAAFDRLRQLERRAKSKRLGAWAKQSKKTSGVEGMFDLDPDEPTPGARPAWIIDEEPVEVYADKWSNVPIVAFLRAEAFINTEQFEDAEIAMRKLLRRFPTHPQKPRIEFYLALSIAMQERFDEAIQLFRAWLQEHPDHILAADVQYWLPISMYYHGQYEEALPMFTAYAKNNPLNNYAPEAIYRAACCRYALEEYKRCAADVATWLQEYPNHYFRHEAAIMRGDALAALGELDTAKAAYRLALEPAGGPFYYMGLTQIARVYKALGTTNDYLAMSQEYAQFIKSMPADGNIIDAAYHAGWALRQIKRHDQARTLYWQMIERHGNTPDWEGFDLMLADLAGMYSRGAGAYSQELQDRYNKALANQRLTLAARLTWAQAQLLPPDDQARQLAIFSGRFKPDYLGPETLLWLGQAWIENGLTSSGIPNLELLLEKFPASRHVPAAQALLAEQALEAKEYDTALIYAQTVLDSAAELSVFIEATFIRAEALRHLNRGGEAIADYNAILANRAAPRRLKPAALLGIAACHEAQHEYAQAIAYYQRVYVLYGAYKKAVVTAYIRSGDCFEKLGDKTAALNTYREFLESAHSPGTAAAARARQRIAALSSGPSS